MPHEKDMDTDIRSIMTLYQGKAIEVPYSMITGPEEINYRVHQSLVIAPDPALIGVLKTWEQYGMQFQRPRIENAISMNIDPVDLVARGLQNRIFREALMAYILSYVRSNEGEILRGVPLTHMPRKPRTFELEDRIIRLMAPIPRTPIGSYLDLLGKGILAQRLGLALSEQTIYPMPGPRYGDGPLNLVTILLALHHLMDPTLVLQSIYDSMAPGGLIVVAEYDFRDENGMDIFLDAIHGVSDQIDGDDMSRHIGPEPTRTSYRTRFEWHTMFVDLGLEHMVTSMDSMNNVRLQMETKEPCIESKSRGRDMMVAEAREGGCPGWINANPRRLFISIYRKTPIPGSNLVVEGLPMLERPTAIAPNLGSIFPRRGGRGGSLPALREGVNYDRESLAHAIPWPQAIEISKLILETTRDTYPGRRFNIVVANAGLGTMVIGLMGNPVLNPIQAMESDPKLHAFLLANMALYGPSPPTQIQQDPSLYRMPVSSSQEILIYMPPLTMDVTLVSKGGILITDSEDMARKAITTGTLLVILHLPSDQRTTIPVRPSHIPNVYVILPSSEIRAETPSRPPIAPIERPTISMPRDFLGLIALIRDRFPDLLSTAESIIPGVMIEEEEALHRAVLERLSQA